MPDFEDGKTHYVRQRGRSKELRVRVFFTFGGYMDGFIPNDLLRFNPVAVTIQVQREEHERRRKSYTFDKGAVKRMEVRGLS